MVAAAALATFATACTALLDLNGFSSGERPNGTPDLPAAPVDAGVSEVGPVGPGEAGSGRFCDAWPAARFCTDFDGIPVSSLPLTTQVGTLELTNTLSVSPPTSALVTLDTPANRLGFAGVDLKLGKAGSTLRVSFDVQVMSHSKDYTESTVIQSTKDGGDCEIYLTLQESSWAVSSGCPATPQRELGSIPFDRWVNVTITLDTTTEIGTIAADQVTQTFPIPAAFAGGALRIFAGVFYAKPSSGPIRLALDNLVVAD